MKNSIFIYFIKIVCKLLSHLYIHIYIYTYIYIYIYIYRERERERERERRERERGCITVTRRLSNLQTIIIK